MRWPTLLTAAAVTVGLGGCGFFGGDEEETPATTQEATPAATTPAEDSLEEGPALEQEPAAALEEAPALEQEPAAAPARETRAQPAVAAVDRPWTPTAAGTVDPGMTREQVVAVWGAPAAERSAENWIYLYYRNGCEVTCGTDDVVFLQDGQVVDAIVRWSGHTYSGISSSPPGRTAEPTLPSGEIG